MRYIFTYFLVLLAITAAPAWAAQPTSIPQDKMAAVIFTYHRIGEDQYPATSLRQEQFESHIRELQEEEYSVIALPDVVKAFANDKKLPPRSVVLTFDGAHRSTFEQAIPLLLKNDMPFTLFLPTDHIDRASPRHMSWDDLRKLSRNKLVTIGLHTSGYSHLQNKTREDLTRQINKARARYREELDKEPAFFAYPFGEYSQPFQEIIEQQEFAAALGQQSSVAHTGSDLLALPRFTMTESHGGLERFRLTARALPLPVTDIEPKDPHLSTAQPVIGFTLDPNLGDTLDKLSCFASGQEKPDMEIVGGNRVELRLQKAFEEPRARINCTLPAPPGDTDEAPRWRWFGMLMTTPATAALETSERQ